MDREKLIDALDAIYVTDGFLRVEEALSQAAGVDFDSLDDNDRQEGFYVNFTDEQLQKALDLLKKRVYFVYFVEKPGSDFYIGIFSSLQKAMDYLNEKVGLTGETYTTGDVTVVYDVDGTGYRITEWEVNNGKL